MPGARPSGGRVSGIGDSLKKAASLGRVVAVEPPRWAAPSPRRFAGGAAAAVVTTLLLVSGSGAAAAATGPTAAYVLPLSAANITDHNLTYADNMRLLDPPCPASFTVSLSSTLVATGAYPADRTEVEVGIGPVPAGAEETNITPLLILQEAASGLLRLQYVPFAMNDTYGFVVYAGTPVPAGPHPFLGHTLTLEYVETAPPVPAYGYTLDYGRTTGNLTVLWDGSVLVPPYPVAWASFGAFYTYGLTTGAFASGAVFTNVTPAAAEPPPPAVSALGAGGTLGSVPLWAIAGAIGVIVGGAGASVAARWGRARH